MEEEEIERLLGDDVRLLIGDITDPENIKSPLIVRKSYQLISGYQNKMRLNPQFEIRIVKMLLSEINAKINHDR